MPWSETSPMDQKTQFVADYRREFFSFAELCRRFGISRKTGYKWIARYEESGPQGLGDRSRRPHSCSHQTDPRIVDAVLEARKVRSRVIGNNLVQAHHFPAAFAASSIHLPSVSWSTYLYALYPFDSILAGMAPAGSVLPFSSFTWCI